MKALKIDISGFPLLDYFVMEDEDVEERPLKRAKRPTAPGGDHADFMKSLNPEEFLNQLSKDAVDKTLSRLNMSFPSGVPNARTGLFIQQPEHGMYFRNVHGNLAFQRTAELGEAPHMHLYALYKLCQSFKDLSPGFEKFLIEEGDKRKQDITIAPTFEVKQEAVEMIGDI